MVRYGLRILWGRQILESNGKPSAHAETACSICFSAPSWFPCVHHEVTEVRPTLAFFRDETMGMNDFECALLLFFGLVKPTKLSLENPQFG